MKYIFKILNYCYSQNQEHKKKAYLICLHGISTQVFAEYKLCNKMIKQAQISSARK